MSPPLTPKTSVLAATAFPFRATILWSKIKCYLLEFDAGVLLLRILLASFLTIHIWGDLLLIIQHLLFGSPI